MDRASSLIYPGGRTLAGWWRQLAPHHPLALGIGYAFLHRIETTVSVLGEQPVEPLAHLILQALALDGGDSLATQDLHQRLHLPIPMMHRVLTGMQDDGLLALAGADQWRLTERGRTALERGAYPMRSRARRTFPFLECLDPSGTRRGPPQFVPIAECIAMPWMVEEACRFDISVLQHCIEQGRAWKEACGFPPNVEIAPGNLEAWEQVVVDRPERVMLALIQTREEVIGFGVKPENWTLLDRTPVLRLPRASAIWPGEPALNVWQDAWRSWCKQRQLPANEADACELTYQPPRLEVQAPSRLVQRLQAARSDVFKGDAWVLAGDDYLRVAAQLSMRIS